MSDFRKLGDNIYASPQIELADLDEAAALGIRLVINNRPDGEVARQVPGAQVEARVRALGLDYRAIPVSPSGIAADQVPEMAEALRTAAGSVLAYCRSGTRSTLLWALAQASTGGDLDEITAAAAAAGYDLASIRPAMEALAGQAAASG